MAPLVWISLFVSALAVGIGLAFAIVRGLASWRAFTRFQGRADDLLLALERNVGGVEERLARADRTSQRLTDAQARLRVSLAEAAVLANAAAEARALLAGVRAAMPGK